MDRRLARRFVALAAAYAVALNMLLPVMAALVTPAVGGAIGLTIICSADGVGAIGDRGAPERPQPACPCCAVCALPGCSAAALPPLAVYWPGVALVGAVPIALRRGGRQPQTFWPGDALARGPPLA
jgi:hypothetical protein